MSNPDLLSFSIPKGSRTVLRIPPSMPFVVDPYLCPGEAHFLVDGECVAIVVGMAHRVVVEEGGDAPST